MYAQTIKTKVVVFEPEEVRFLQKDGPLRPASNYKSMVVPVSELQSWAGVFENDSEAEMLRISGLRVAGIECSVQQKGE